MSDHGSRLAPLRWSSPLSDPRRTVGRFQATTERLVRLRYGFVLPHGDARHAADTAKLCEDSGGFAEFGEETDRVVRAELLDECLEITTGLWAGQPFAYAGKHYTVQPCSFMPPPPPMQQPCIPIWVVGAWGRPRSMRRALRYDGLLPHVSHPDEISAELVADTRAHAAAVAARAKAEPYAEAGATWWIESPWGITGDDAAERLRARIVAGPPR